MEAGRPVRSIAVILVREDNGPDQDGGDEEDRGFWVCFEGRAIGTYCWVEREMREWEVSDGCKGFSLQVSYCFGSRTEAGGVCFHGRHCSNLLHRSQT